MGRKRKRSFRRGYNRTSGLYGRQRKRRRFARVEKKFTDGELDQDPIGQAGVAIVNTSSDTPITTTASLNGIVQDTGESERIGRKCTVTNILIRFNFEFVNGQVLGTLAAANTAHETLRVIIYLDRQCNGTAATALQLLNTDTYNSYRNLANVKRFKILWDYHRSFNSTAIAAYNGADADSYRVIADYTKAVSIKCFIPIEFDGTTGGALSSIRSNNIGIMIWSKHGGRMRVGDSPVRIRFIDY